MLQQDQAQQKPKTASQSAFGEENQIPSHPSDLASLPLRLTFLTERARKQKRWLYGLLFGPMLFMLLWLLLSNFWIPALHLDTDLIPYICGPIFAVQGLEMVGLFLLVKQMRKTLRELAQIDDIRAIGPLLDILGNANDRQISVIGNQALLSLLARLQPVDAPLLTNNQYHHLFRMLASRRHPNLVLTILQALEKIGDNRAVKPVERLAKRGRSPAIREEAARILPILRERQPQENAPATLLRASQSGVEGLLRATEQGTGADTQQLLRANSGKEKPEG